MKSLSPFNQSVLEAAIQYAQRGWSVFPSNGKVPLLKEWPTKASTEPKEFEDWFANGNNVGIATGKKSSLVVVDVDGQEGLDSLEKLEKLNGGLPPTWTVNSPNDGKHFYFAYPPGIDKIKSRPLPSASNIDIKGDGGCIIAPPSALGGKHYNVVDSSTVAELPGWLLKLIDDDSDCGFVATAGSELKGFKQGTRNEGVFKAACRYKKSGLSKAEARELVLAIADKCNPPLPTQEALSCLGSAWSYGPEQYSKPSVVSAIDLFESEIDPPTWIVPNVLPAGVSVVAGNPKVGKSWMMLDLALSVAPGESWMGEFDTVKGDVLYLALEDTDWRLKQRMNKLLLDTKPDKGLHISFQWPKTDSGGLDYLDAWLTKRSNTKLIVIDTLQMIRPEAKKADTSYAHDYKAIQVLRQFADEHKIAVVLVHHLRKAKSADPFERVSGTFGLTGAADTIFVLDRDPSSKHADLHVRGRDVGDKNFALIFDGDLGRWKLFGEAELPATQSQMAIVIAVQGGSLTPMGIAEEIGKDVQYIKNTLPVLLEKGLVMKSGHGKYVSSMYELEKSL